MTRTRTIGVLGAVLGVLLGIAGCAATTSAPPQLAAAAGAQAPPTAGAGSCHYRGALPDAVCTPGEADPRVRADTLRSTICSAGCSPWNSTISYQLLWAATHLLPISGPNRGTGPTVPTSKTWLEARLAAMVCAGQLPLATAQHDIAADWVAAYHKYVGPN